jgi:hypothetical protein
VLTDVGDVPIQEIRDCGVEDDRLMHVISESVKAVMEEVNILSHEDCFVIFFVDYARYLPIYRYH